jgi:hypothetical protein
MLINLIKTHALANAQAGNWAGVAAILNAPTPLEGLRISGKQTILGLVSLGRDPDAIRLILESTPSGRGLLDLLPNVGVNWVDPLTLAVLEKNTGDGKLSVADVNALKSLSARSSSLAGEAVTAEQCQAAWERDVLAQIWTTALNDGGINQALAAGDRDALKSALTTLLESL